MWPFIKEGIHGVDRTDWDTISEAAQKCYDKEWGEEDKSPLFGIAEEYCWCEGKEQKIKWGMLCKSFI